MFWICKFQVRDVEEYERSEEFLEIVESERPPVEHDGFDCTAEYGPFKTYEAAEAKLIEIHTLDELEVDDLMATF